MDAAKKVIGSAKLQKSEREIIKHCERRSEARRRNSKSSHEHRHHDSLVRSTCSS